MNEIEYQTKNLVATIKKSNEYNEYQRLYGDLESDTNLLQRLNEFRRKSYTIQLSQGGNSLTICKQLREEYKDILMIPNVQDFLVAEHKVNKIIRSINHCILDHVDLKVDFL